MTRPNAKLTVVHDEIVEKVPTTYHLDMGGHTLVGESKSVLFSYRTSGAITDPEDDRTYASSYQVAWTGTIQQLYEHAQAVLRVLHEQGVLTQALVQMLEDLPPEKRKP